MVGQHTRSRWYISWVGVCGAVPIVFATYPLLAGIGSAQMIFNIVFFISLTSVLIQGTSLPIIAKWLNVTLPEKFKAKMPSEMILQEQVKSEFFANPVLEGSPIIGKRILDLQFPPSVVMAMIRQRNEFLTPTGSMVIQENDVLMILSENKKGIESVSKCLGETAKA